MTREEQLKFCKVCKNKKFNRDLGLICSITNARADFEDTCDSFEEDTTVTNKSYLSDFDINITGKLASKNKRFINCVVDWICVLIFGSAIAVALGIILAFVAPESLYLFEESNALFDYLYRAATGIIFYTIFESATGKTLGKYITKTKVVNEKGEKPKTTTIFIRSCCRYVPFDAFSFLGPIGEGWHDKWSNTSVVEI